MNNSKKNVYWPQLDGVRSLAFFLVFIGHFGPFPQHNLIPGSFIHKMIMCYNVLINWGWAGVDLFFVLSGFLITSLLIKEKKDFGDIQYRWFITRRILRIWPLYFLAITLGFFIFPLISVFGINFGTNLWNNMMKNSFIPFVIFLGNFPLAFKVFHISQIISPLWSVSIEEQFYLVWGWCIKKIKNIRKILIIALLFSICARQFLFLLGVDYKIYYYMTFTHLDPIVLGCLLAYISDIKSYQYLGKFAFFISFIGFILMISTNQSIFDNTIFSCWSIFFTSLLCFLFLFSLLTWKPIINYFSASFLKNVGRLTYGMYIFHNLGIAFAESILKRIDHGLSQELLWITKFILALNIVYLMAYLSWNFFEIHFNSLRKYYSRISSGYSKTKNVDKIAPVLYS